MASALRVPGNVVVMLARYIPFPNPKFPNPYAKQLGRIGPSEDAGVSEKYGNNDDDNGDHWSSDAVWHRN